MLELPAYRWPSVEIWCWVCTTAPACLAARGLLIILSLMIVLWFLSSYPLRRTLTGQPSNSSLAGRLGGWLEPR